MKVEGFKALDAALGELTPAAGKNVLRRVGRRALEPFDAEWRAHAPHLTGTLEESGGVGSNLSRRQRQLVRRESTVEVFAGPGANPQAIQGEFGNEHQAPTPYVRPAWDAKQGEALDIVKADLGDEIAKAAARGAKRAARLAAKAGG